MNVCFRFSINIVVVVVLQSFEPFINLSSYGNVITPLGIDHYKGSTLKHDRNVLADMLATKLNEHCRSLTECQHDPALPAINLHITSTLNPKLNPKP